MTDDDLIALFDRAVGEMRGHFDATAGGIREYFDASVGEIRRHFDVTAERLDVRVDWVVEALSLVDHKVDRNAMEIREEMRQGFADLRAVIKFLHLH